MKNSNPVRLGSVRTMLLAAITGLLLFQGVFAVNLGRKSSIAGDNQNPADKAAPSAVLRLGEIVPNPYDEGQAIQFTLSVRQVITLKLCSADGREVITMLDGIQERGIHTIPLPSKNLAKGEYICRLEGLATDVRYLTLSRQFVQAQVQ